MQLFSSSKLILLHLSLEFCYSGLQKNSGNTLNSTSRNVLTICAYCNNSYYISYNNCET